MSYASLCLLILKYICHPQIKQMHPPDDELQLFDNSKFSRSIWIEKMKTFQSLSNQWLCSQTSKMSYMGYITHSWCIRMPHIWRRKSSFEPLSEYFLKTLFHCFIFIMCCIHFRQTLSSLAQTLIRWREIMYYGTSVLWLKIK